MLVYPIVIPLWDIRCGRGGSWLTKLADMHVRVPALLKGQVEAVADRRHMKLSEAVRQALLEWVEKHGRESLPPGQRVAGEQESTE